MNGHVLDVRVAALLTLYAGYLTTAGNRMSNGSTPIAVPSTVREETLRLAREILADVPRVPASDRSNAAWLPEMPPFGQVAT